jgi:hypothetical protein
MAVTSIQIRNYEYYVFSSRGSSDPASAVILLYERTTRELHRCSSPTMTKS